MDKILSLNQLSFPAPRKGNFYIIALIVLSGFYGLSLSAQAEEGITATKPFELGTFTKKSEDFKRPVPPIQQTQKIDAEGLFQKVLACYPSRSRFDLTVKMQARYGIQDKDYGGDLGGYYFGIVAEMPLLDGSEQLDRQRKREYDRRTETAKNIADFIQAIAKRNQIARQIGLFAALEQRSQVRVQMGVTSISEQVGHLKSVITAQKELVTAGAKILETRLALSGQCDSGRIEAMNRYLRRLANGAGGVK